ncbi:hypothetical protein BBD42_22635 [Paenibacillus sp. BIHB 4019]|uniref:Prenylated flavin chaperone LpdD-like domain-containing protein n=1 Tax=Paenibacillus sp. BIHB 4019 TaxID=1870819 RepID=A0A1B2DMP0_9BACL|nr:hypothetical protein [Paenibacillus sp. BIHB 4019]ANY68969.1 hypothetical protein BBD42_22635 [Paenibacillus sp. BIHB 4019]
MEQHMEQHIEQHIEQQMEQQMNMKVKKTEKVDIRVLAMGQDLVFLVTGGEAHIGAAATAYWIDGGHAPKCDAHTLPGHREGELAAELAIMAASSLGVTATVVVGIHLEQPASHDIVSIVTLAKEAMREQTDKLAALGDQQEKSLPTDET